MMNLRFLSAGPILLLAALSTSSEAVAWDIPAQCRLNEGAGVIQELELPEDLAESGSPEAIALHSLRSEGLYWGAVSPWLLGNSPDPRFRKAAILVQLAMMRAHQIARGQLVPLDAGVAWYRDFFRERANHSITYTPEQKKLTRELLETLRKGSYYDPEGKDVGTGARALCLRHRSFRCATGLIDILRFMSAGSFNGARMSALEVWDDVLTDERYRRAVLLLAVTVADRLLDEGSMEGNLLDDAREAFSVVFPADRAEHAVWQYLAFYSTRGSSVHLLQDLFVDSSWELAIAHYLVSASLPLLDVRDAPRRYSLPRGIEAGCDFGRAYHFWMSAYLARRALGIQGDRSGAMTASYIAGYGYEFQSTTWGRNPVLDLLTPLYDLRKNRIRFNLGFKAAGALYGAYGDKLQGKISVDDLILRIFEKSKETGKSEFEIWRDSEDPWKRFRMQLKVFAPDAAYKKAIKSIEQERNPL